MPETDFIGWRESIGDEPCEVEGFRLGVNRATDLNGEDQTDCVLPRIETSNLAPVCEILGDIDWLRVGRKAEDDPRSERAIQFARDRLLKTLVQREASSDQAPTFTLMWRFPADQPHPDRLLSVLTNSENVDAGNRNRGLHKFPFRRR